MILKADKSINMELTSGKGLYLYFINMAGAPAGLQHGRREDLQDCGMAGGPAVTYKQWGNEPTLFLGSCSCITTWPSCRSEASWSAGALTLLQFHPWTKFHQESPEVPLNLCFTLKLQCCELMIRLAISESGKAESTGHSVYRKHMDFKGCFK